MNEAGGDRLFDVTGNGNHATLANSDLTTCWVGSPLGGAVNFDGTDAYAAVADHASISPTAAMSVSGRFKLTGTPAEVAGVCMKCEDGQWDDGYGVYWINNPTVGNVASLVFFVSIFDGTEGSGGMAYIPFDYATDRNWHHFAGTYDGATVSIYIDGVKGTDDAYDGGITTNTSRLFIGTHTLNTDTPGETSSEVTPGILDDFRIYDRALPQDEVRQLHTEPFANVTPPRYRHQAVAISGVLAKQPTRNVYVAEPKPIGKLSRMAPTTRGLVGWWAFNEGGGPNVRDQSGEQNTGTITNATLPEAWIGSIHGCGVQLDGVNDYITIPTTPRLQVETITVSMWLRMTALPVAPLALFSLLESGSIGTAGYGVFMDPSGRLGFLFNTSGGIQRGGSATFFTPPGDWVHLAITYNGAVSGDALYINGVPQTIGSITGINRLNQGGLITANSSALTFGARLGTSLFYNGAYDDIRLYNRALGPSEIATIYSNPLSGFASSGLVSNRLLNFAGVSVGGGGVQLFKRRRR